MGSWAARFVAVFFIFLLTTTESFSANLPVINEGEIAAVLRAILSPPLKYVLLQGVVTIDPAAGPSCAKCAYSVNIAAGGGSPYYWEVIGQPAGDATEVRGNPAVLKALQAAASEGLITLTPAPDGSQAYDAKATQTGRLYLDRDLFVATIPGPNISNMKIVKSELRKPAAETFGVVSANYSVETTTVYQKLRSAVFGLEEEAHNGDRKLVALFKYNAPNRQWQLFAMDDSGLDADFTTHQVREALIRFTGHE